MAVKQQSEAGLIVLVPVFNDWEAVSLLLPALDRELAASGLDAEVILVDDASITAAPPTLVSGAFVAIKSVDVLVLRRNLGHQRAIAVGLAFVEANRACRAVVVMDGDGEDEPADVPRLVRECAAAEDRKIIFAERTRRSENVLFKIFYHLYRLIHLVLTGVRVRAGNFSVVPTAALHRLVVASDLWNHYAAAVYKSQLPIGMLSTCRGKRLTGRSQMNLVALVVHGLSAMAVFGDRIGVRLLIAVGVAIVLMGGLLVTVIGIRFLTPLAIPGWATYTTGLLILMLAQMLLIALVFAFVILAARDTASVLPTRDYVHFVGGIQRVYGRDG
jgi:hypothetical protein